MRIEALKTGQRNINKGMSSINTTIATTCKKVEDVMNVTNSHVDLLKLLSYKSIDIEARSRRCSIIIRGIPEERNENYLQVTRKFI